MFPLERGPFWVASCGFFAIAAVLVFRAARGADRRLWFWTGMLLAALTLGKLFDLQSLVTGTGRCLAMLNGLYDLRRPLQAAAVLALILLSGAATLLTLRHRQGNALLICGLGLLLTFLAIRALSFHPVDALLSQRPLGLPLSRLTEVLALLPIIHAALRRRAIGSGLLRLGAVRPPQP